MDASGHCCSDICAQKDSKFFGLNLICSECNSPAYINCILARPSPSFREFCLTFMIIDDEDKSLIASKQKMTEMKNTLSSMFCTRNSNFAFKCVNCKNFDLFKHENSIQLNNTFVANVGSVGKDTTNSNIASKNRVLIRMQLNLKNHLMVIVLILLLQMFIHLILMPNRKIYTMIN